MARKLEMPENQKITYQEIRTMMLKLAQAALENGGDNITLEDPYVKLKFEAEWKGELR